MLATVEKIEGGFAVLDHNGEALVGYRNKKHAEAFAVGHINMIFGDAEYYNERFTRVRAYLADRANRVSVPSAQLELF